MTQISFGFPDIVFQDLYDRDGLIKIDQAFLRFLGARDHGLRHQIQDIRDDVCGTTALEQSETIIKLAPHLEDFIATLFGIEEQVDALISTHRDLDPIYKVRRLFVQRRAAKKIKPDQAKELDGDALRQRIEDKTFEDFSEESFARNVEEWMREESRFEEELQLALEYSAWALYHPEGQAYHKDSVFFWAADKVDPNEPLSTEPLEGVPHVGHLAYQLSGDHVHSRDGFNLTDQGTDLKGALGETNYCIWCHKQERDSCSKGLKDRKTGEFQKSAFDVTLAGCPLEEKISEMHQVKTEGFSIGALGVITVDNPMCAATGHRICNDCMKACIYQRQEPVNIPEAETRILKDVLSLPFGVEIYSLLTRWNPLNFARPYPKKPTGKKVMVVGLGPAGFTLAHHLMNDGHQVIAVDGAKIEPLPAHISGVDPFGHRRAFQPIENASDLYEALGERIMAGFGGVVEYGITVRWDKNFLKLIRLLLERSSAFSMYSGVRYGGTVTTEMAFDEWGMDHIALCAGAGAPTILGMKNPLLRGVRQASDFLMALQLTGAAKKDSIANLQLRLPVVVVGGGLTAIDTATEALAYYPIQVEKFLSRFEELCEESSEADVRAMWDAEEAVVAEEFIAHAREIRKEKSAAKAEKREADILSLLQKWGGSTIAYRRGLKDSPAYRLNHEEVQKALEEGIRFMPYLSPTENIADDYGHLESVVFDVKDAEPVTLPARSLLVAAGTKPNTILVEEEPGRFKMDGKYFQAIDENDQPVESIFLSKPGQVNILCANYGQKKISYHGDLHPSFGGNVVKAMGGAKQSYPVISKWLAEDVPGSVLEYTEDVIANENKATAHMRQTKLEKHLNEDLRAHVHSVNRLTPTIVEVVLNAPSAARQFKPGQFYRLQNFEALAPSYNGTKMAMEGLAMTGAWVDVKRGLIAVIALEMGGSSNLCAHLKPGEPVILMGPAGMPTEIPSDETVLLAGGGLGNAVLFSIGAACRDAGSKVVYFAGYKANKDIYYREKIEEASDVVVWCCDEAPNFEAGRSQDHVFHGNIVQAMEAYASGALGEAQIPMADVDRMIVIGSDRMMSAVRDAKNNLLAPYLVKKPEGVASINSPMQCMMKRICAQCLQPHVDKSTGETKIVFSCFNQDQDMDMVDFKSLSERLRQNTVQEKLTARWIAHCFEKSKDVLDRDVV